MQDRVNWFGIDFGTTNSAVFSFTGEDSENIIDMRYGDDEGRPFPSIVAIDKNTGEVITGREAKEKKNSLMETHEYFSSIKSIIDSDKIWSIAGKEYEPEDIVGMILSSLKKRVEERQGCALDEAVFAVPIGYSSVKRVHLRSAAEKAGIHVKMLVSEPTAAFCSHYEDLKNCKNVAVFDWGGGTLDVVILRIDNGEINELGSDGMDFAGDKIDRKLAEKMHTIFTRKNNSTMSFDELDPHTKDQLLTKCEKAKCDFEDEDIVTIAINKYGNLGTVRESIKYEYFELLLEHDINEAVDCLKRAIDKSGLNIENIDRILCVGGSSRLRPLREKLEKIFGEEMLYYPNRVMWDIARGAAIVSIKSGSYRLSKPIGMELCDGSFLPLFDEGKRIPCEKISVKLSVVDQDEQNGFGEARFIFSDSGNPENRELYEPLIMPLRGFADEYITLSCYVDQNNIFKLKLSSNRVHKSHDKEWSYDNLKMRFHIGE